MLCGWDLVCVCVFVCEVEMSLYNGIDNNNDIP